MERRRIKSSDERTTLTDLWGLALLNAAVALPTGSVLWLILNGFPVVWVGWIPAQSILWFTAAMAALGALTREAWLADLYGWLWRSIVRWFTHADTP